MTVIISNDRFARALIAGQGAVELFETTGKADVAAFKLALLALETNAVKSATHASVRAADLIAVLVRGKVVVGSCGVERNAKMASNLAAALGYIIPENQPQTEEIEKELRIHRSEWCGHFHIG